MATINKDFKIKSGLIVEGSTATVNGNQVLTENASNQYILNLIGGETLVKSVSNEFDVSVAGELSIDRATVDAYYDAAGDAAAAQLAAEATASADATNKANAAQAAAEATASADATSKANAAQSAAEATASADATNKANAAQAAAEDYADALINDASNLSTEVWSAYKTNTEIGLAQAAAEQHADDVVAALVGSAPALLDTLQELATALDNDPDAINSLQSIAAGKQDALTAGSNIDITGATISVTGLDTEDVAESVAGPLYFTNQRALDATALAYDVAGAALTAETNAIAHADALTTDDVAEGTTQYFTDARAKESAGDLLAGAITTNVDISYVGGVLTVNAENGVADSTTDDLDEGSTNLYFTDSRAIGAVSGADITPNTVRIDTYRKEEGSRISVANASTATVHSFDYPYESAKYVVRVVGWVGGVKHSQITEILLTTDGSNNIAMTEYGTTHTSTEPLATFSAAWSGTYDLTVTTAVSGCEVIAAATLLSWAD